MKRSDSARVLPSFLASLVVAACAVRPAEPATGGTVYFSNIAPMEGIDAPVFDVDGVTPLEGPRFLAQLWAGPAPDALEPVGQPEPFLSGRDAGYVVAEQGMVIIPSVAAGEPAFVELRAWDGATAASWEASWEQGGPAGRSPVFSVLTGGGGEPPAVPADLVGLESFQLTWREDAPPLIVRQPTPISVSVGESALLRVEVARAGESGVTFRWLHNGEPVPAVSGPEFQLPEVQPKDAGEYQVIVTNPWGEVASAVVRVEVIFPRGTVSFSNIVPMAGIDAPVFDVDGVTPLEGPRFLAQLWAGPAPDALEPVGQPEPFLSGRDAGYVVAEQGMVIIPSVAAGEPAFVELRAWDGAAAASWEAAWEEGGPAGRSPVFSVLTGGGGEPPADPADLVGLESFQLTWREDVPPLIVRQPTPISVRVGESALLRVEVARADESGVTFRWLHNGEPVPAVSGPEIQLPEVQPKDAGEYQVIVSNPWGEVASAVVRVEVIFPGGTVYFSNIVPMAGIDAPVFDVDGVTGLTGPDYVVQLWAGPEPSSLAPVGAAVPFRSGEHGDAGYWNAPTPSRTIDTVPAGEPAWMQVVVWNQRFGSMFEEAVAVGSPHGASPVFSVVTGGGGAPPAVPADMVGLESFKLEPGVWPPEFVQQPRGGSFFAGEPLVLTTEISGDGPMALQWFHDDIPVPGANDAVLDLGLLTPASAGSYRLRAAGPLVTAWSQRVSVDVFPAPPPGATVLFINRYAEAGLDAPVLQADGETPVAGPDFVVQLWAGAAPEELTPVGDPAPLLAGPGAGYWEPLGNPALALPGVTPGEPAYVQVRVWEADQPDPDTALQAGGWVGNSEVLEVATGGSIERPRPAVLTGLTSIVLGRLPRFDPVSAGGEFEQGTRVSLRINVQSPDPPELQWRKDGVEVPGANSMVLQLPAAQVADSGNYTLVARNRTGTAESEAIAIQVVPVPGRIYFHNKELVLQADNWTPLMGSDYLAQLYVGATPDELTPVGAPAPFGEGMQSGTVYGGFVFLPEFPAGTTVSVQMRAWPAPYPDFESAEAAEAPTGVSAVIQVVTGGGAIPAPSLRSLPGFSLIPKHPVVLLQPRSLWLVAGEEATFPTTWAGVDHAWFQWQELVGEGTWTDIPEATNQTYVVHAVSAADDGRTFRLTAGDEAGIVATEAASIRLSPTRSIGDTDGMFDLRLRPETGPQYAIEFSANLVEWETLITLEAAPPTLTLQENPETRETYETRFYRARDTATGQVASENIAGFARRLLRPGVNLVGVPFEAPDNRVSTLFAGAPEGTTVYLFDAENQQWLINSYAFGSWLLPEQRLPLLEGCVLRLSREEGYWATFGGDVPQGHFTRALHTGWSLNSPPLPVRGLVAATFRVPVDYLDAAALWVGRTQEFNILFNSGPGWEDDAPELEPGEGFWVYRHVPTVWDISYSYPP